LIRQTKFPIRSMKKIFVSLTILTALLGCSKQSTQTSQTTSSLIPTNPAEITMIETAETKEWHKIEAESAGFFAAKDFGKLEDLANDYRTSKADIASGIWKLEAVYRGIVPDVNKSDGEWEQSFVTLHDWIQAKPDSITARVALADMLVDYGWKARGNGYANTVTESGQKLMEKRLIEAVQVLQKAEDLKQKCPFYWTVMMGAALGLGADHSQFETLFQKAIAYDPDFTGYYSAKAYYLTPRWYGQPGDMEAFLEKAADQVGGEDGDVLYARVAWYVQLLTGDVFDEHGLSWERTDRGFEIIEERYPDSPYVQNARAYMAVMGCEKTLAPRKLVTALHGQIDPKVWTSKENFIRLTKTLNPH
jgi:hypothetical protein